MLIFLSMLETDEERQLFMELYSQYGNAMLRVAKRYFIGDPTMAEDAVQNAWLRVVDKFSRVQDIPRKKRGAYLVIIAKNESISLLRKQHKELSFDETVVADKGNFDLKGITPKILLKPYKKCRKYIVQ